MSTYTNPIIPGFASDPSVVFVEGTFFLVNSSFHVFPGLPIYASKNLRTWTQIGNAVNRPGQIHLSNATTDSFPTGPNKHLVAAPGLFAPTIRWYNGTSYIICTNTSRNQGEELRTDNFFIKTTNIWANEWSDPIWFECDEIDPSLLFDGNTGKVYVQGSHREGTVGDQLCSIRKLEIDIMSGRKLSETRAIWGYDPAMSPVISDIEGPHMYQKDRDIWGPFEVYEQNPVPTAAEKDVGCIHWTKDPQNIGMLDDLVRLTGY